VGREWGCEFGPQNFFPESPGLVKMQSEFRYNKKVKTWQATNCGKLPERTYNFLALPFSVTIL